MPDINFGLLDTQGRAPQVQTFQTPAAPNTQALLGGLAQGQQMAGNAAQIAAARQALAHAKVMDPLAEQKASQDVASGAIDLTQKQRTEQDILAQRAAAAKSWDAYIQKKMETDPEGANAALDKKAQMEGSILKNKQSFEDLTNSEALHASDQMTKGGSIMHDIMTQGTDPNTGKQDDAKIVQAYNSQYPQIHAVDPKNAPDPKTATPAQIEAYGASSMKIGLDYSLGMKTKYLEMQEAAKQAEATKGNITTDAIKNSQVSAASAIPVRQAAQQYQDLLSQVTPNQVGPGFNLSLKGKQIISALGGDPNLSVPEALKLASNKLLVNNLKTLKTMPRSSAVIDTISGANANPNLQLDVQKNALTNILQESNENIVKPDFMQDFKNKNDNDLAGVNTSWQKFLDADPTYQKTGQHDPQWTSNPDNYKPFLDRDYKAPEVKKEAVSAKTPTNLPSIDEVTAELLKRGIK